VHAGARSLLSNAQHVAVDPSEVDLLRCVEVITLHVIVVIVVVVVVVVNC
jgi:hypothetical protein